MKGLKLIIAVLVIAILGGLGTVAAHMYSNSPRKDTPLIYANDDMLQEMWSSYKRNYIEAGSFRTLDKQQDNISTSEGQSYTMLRAVWMDDKATFDSSWQWTKDNIQRDDKLMSWRYGELADGNYGVQTDVGGQNTVSVGDTDIALGLLMAYSRWHDDDYLYDALPIINSVWEQEVILVDGKPVLLANDLERNNPTAVIINPSYLSPHAYKLFAKVDKKHDWQALASNSYTILREVSASKLNRTTSAGLPADWVSLNRTTGQYAAVADPKLTTNYSFDAIRSTWRLALDYAWFQDSRSRELLASYSQLGQAWQADGAIYSSYQHDGKALTDQQTPATYGATIGYFKVIDPKTAETIYRTKLATLYSPDEQKPAQPLGYYDDNWSWFGTALYLDELPNLTIDNTAPKAGKE